MNMKEWEEKAGVIFLKQIGIKPGYTILDFGSRVGHYTIPAAIAVGEHGTVFALDKETAPLNELKQKSKKLSLHNIKIIKTKEMIKIDLEAGSIDMILLYDVLHYLTFDKRKLIYNEAYHILKNTGLLSVYPKHISTDYALDEFRNMTLEDVHNEIQDSNYLYKEKHCGLISHDDGFNQGCIYNYMKRY